MQFRYNYNRNVKVIILPICYSISYYTKRYITIMKYVNIISDTTRAIRNAQFFNYYKLYHCVRHT